MKVKQALMVVFAIGFFTFSLDSHSQGKDLTKGVQLKSKSASSSVKVLTIPALNHHVMDSLLATPEDHPLLDSSNGEYYVNLTSIKPGDKARFYFGIPLPAGTTINQVKVYYGNVSGSLPVSMTASVHGIDLTNGQTTTNLNHSTSVSGNLSGDYVSIMSVPLTLDPQQAYGVEVEFTAPEETTADDHVEANFFGVRIEYM